MIIQPHEFPALIADLKARRGDYEASCAAEALEYLMKKLEERAAE